MPNDSKTYIVNDRATETDALDFTPYVETLVDIIKTGNTPLTIGVFGTWGSGGLSNIGEIDLYKAMLKYMVCSAN